MSCFKSTARKCVSNLLSLKSISIQSHQQSAKLSSFDIFSDENKSRSQSKLMSVKPSRTYREMKLKEGWRYAAVLVPFCLVDKEPSLLFTLRSTNLNKHRGQVSFPGGNRSSSDESLQFTALRETEEELGLPPSTFDIWGQMQSLPGSDGTASVYPFIAYAGEIDVTKLKINQQEVEEAFTVSIRHLCSREHFGQTHFRYKNEYVLPVYTGAPHRIWGLTAVIVHQALNVVADGLYTLKVKQHRIPKHLINHKR